LLEIPKRAERILMLPGNPMPDSVRIHIMKAGRRENHFQVNHFPCNLSGRLPLPVCVAPDADSASGPAVPFQNQRIASAPTPNEVKEL